MITYERYDAKRIKVLRDGVYLCWIERRYFKPTQRKGFYVWDTSGLPGEDLSCPELSRLKLRIRQRFEKMLRTATTEEIAQ